MNQTPVKKILKLLVGFSMSAWINAIINFILMPVITRVIEPSDLGKIDLFVTFCTMLVYASTLGMHQAYMRFFADNLEGITKDNLFAFAVKCSTCGAGIAAIICLIFNKNFTESIMGEQSNHIWVLMALYIFITGFIAISKTRPRMYGNVMSYTVLVVLESLSIKLCYLSLLVTKDVYYSLWVLIFMVGVLMSICLILNRKQIFISISHIPKETKNAIFIYALPTIPVMFVANVNTSLPKIFLNAYFDAGFVGVYTGCLTLVSIITLIQAGINVFWGPFVFENYKSQQRLIQSMHLVITFAIVFCGLGLLATQDIIYCLLGNKYRMSQAFYGFLLCSPIYYTIGETVGIGINIKKKTYWNIVTTSVALISNLVFCYFWVPRFGNLGASFAVAISSIVMLFVKSFIGERYYKVVENPIKTCLTITLFFTGALFSYFFNSQILIRCILIVILMLALVVLYLKDIKQFICQWNIR